MNNRKFALTAYTGAPMQGASGTLIIDLAGLETKDRNPIFRQHDPSRIAGQSDRTMNRLDVLDQLGEIFASTDAGREVVELHDLGFEWQASVGVEVAAVEELAAGVSATVNGRTFTGPGIILRRTILKETSIVPLGRDGATSVIIAGQRPVKPVTPSDAPGQHASRLRALGLLCSAGATFAGATSPADRTGFAAQDQRDRARIAELKAKMDSMGTGGSFNAREWAELKSLERDVTDRDTFTGGDDPKSAALAEWLGGKADRAAFSSRERFVEYRAGELRGHFKRVS